MMDKRVMSKKGNLLTGEVIFLVLNIVFISILIIFVLPRTNSSAFLEEQYAKEIALMIDSSKPGMILHLNMEDAISKAESNSIAAADIVKITGNVVTIKLKEKGQYSYSFFNNVSAEKSNYLDTSNNKEWVFAITEKNEK